MTRNKDRLPEEDDGRTIAPMNVEGMPWYTPERPGSWETTGGEDDWSRRELRFFTWGALKAALLVVGVMCVGLILFVLFCQFIWFRNA